MKPISHETSLLISIVFVAVMIVGPSSRAQADWYFFSGTGHYYGLTSDRLNWTDAEAEAASLGGHLASILDQEEQDFMVSTFVNEQVTGGSRQPFWIGANDVANEGAFDWSSGETFLFEAWQSGEPNNNQGDEDYVAFNFHYGVNQSDLVGTWNDTTNLGSVDGPYRGIIELTTNPVPEPTGAFLVALISIGLFVRRSRLAVVAIVKRQ